MPMNDTQKSLLAEVIIEGLLDVTINNLVDHAYNPFFLNPAISMEAYQNQLLGLGFGPLGRETKIDPRMSTLISLRRIFMGEGAPVILVVDGMFLEDQIKKESVPLNLDKYGPKPSVEEIRSEFVGWWDLYSLFCEERLEKFRDLYKKTHAELESAKQAIKLDFQERYIAFENKDKNYQQILHDVKAELQELQQDNKQLLKAIETQLAQKAELLKANSLLFHMQSPFSLGNEAKLSGDAAEAKDVKSEKPDLKTFAPTDGLTLTPVDDEKTKLKERAWKYNVLRHNLAAAAKVVANPDNEVDDQFAEVLDTSTLLYKDRDAETLVFEYLDKTPTRMLEAKLNHAKAEFKRFAASFDPTETQLVTLFDGPMQTPWHIDPRAFNETQLGLSEIQRLSAAFVVSKQTFPLAAARVNIQLGEKQATYQELFQSRLATLRRQRTNVLGIDESVIFTARAGHAILEQAYREGVSIKASFSAQFQAPIDGWFNLGAYQRIAGVDVLQPIQEARDGIQDFQAGQGACMDMTYSHSGWGARTLTQTMVTEHKVQALQESKSDAAQAVGKAIQKSTETGEYVLFAASFEKIDHPQLPDNAAEYFYDKHTAEQSRAMKRQTAFMHMAESKKARERLQQAQIKLAEAREKLTTALVAKRKSLESVQEKLDDKGRAVKITEAEETLKKSLALSTTFPPAPKLEVQKPTTAKWLAEYNDAKSPDYKNFEEYLDVMEGAYEPYFKLLTDQERGYAGKAYFPRLSVDKTITITQVPDWNNWILGSLHHISITVYFGTPETDVKKSKLRFEYNVHTTPYNMPSPKFPGEEFIGPLERQVLWYEGPFGKFKDAVVLSGCEINSLDELKPLSFILHPYADSKDPEALGFVRKDFRLPGSVGQVKFKEGSHYHLNITFAAGSRIAQYVAMQAWRPMMIVSAKHLEHLQNGEEKFVVTQSRPFTNFVTNWAQGVESKPDDKEQQAAEVALMQEAEEQKAAAKALQQTECSAAAAAGAGATATGAIFSQPAMPVSGGRSADFGAGASDPRDWVAKSGSVVGTARSGGAFDTSFNMHMHGISTNNQVSFQLATAQKPGLLLIDELIAFVFGTNIKTPETSAIRAIQQAHEAVKTRYNANKASFGVLDVKQQTPAADLKENRDPKLLQKLSPSQIDIIPRQYRDIIAIFFAYLEKYEVVFKEQTQRERAIGFENAFFEVLFKRCENVNEDLKKLFEAFAPHNVDSINKGTLKKQLFSIIKEMWLLCRYTDAIIQNGIKALNQRDFEHPEYDPAIIRRNLAALAARQPQILLVPDQEVKQQDAKQEMKPDLTQEQLNELRKNQLAEFGKQHRARLAARREIREQAAQAQVRAAAGAGVAPADQRDEKSVARLAAEQGLMRHNVRRGCSAAEAAGAVTRPGYST